MSEHSRLARRRGWLSRFDRAFGRSGWGARRNKELPALPADPKEYVRIHQAAEVSDFRRRWKRHFETKAERTFLDLRRFESTEIGGPEAALAESLPPCLPGVDSELALHLDPASVLELNAPEFRAVWKTLDGAPELYAATMSNVDAGRAGRPGMPRQETWDSDGSNTDFEPAYVLEAEPLRQEDTPKSPARFREPHPEGARLLL